VAHRTVIRKNRIGRLGELPTPTPDPSSYDAEWAGRDGAPIAFTSRDASDRVVGVSQGQPNPDMRAGKKMKAAAGSKHEPMPGAGKPAGASRVDVVEGEPDAVAMAGDTGAMNPRSPPEMTPAST